MVRSACACGCGQRTRKRDAEGGFWAHGPKKVPEQLKGAAAAASKRKAEKMTSGASQPSSQPRSTHQRDNQVARVTLPACNRVPTIEAAAPVEPLEDARLALSRASGDAATVPRSSDASGRFATILRLPLRGGVPQAVCDMAAALALRRRMSACDVLLLVHRAIWLWERCSIQAASVPSGALAAALLIMASDMEGATAPTVSPKDFATSGIDAQSLKHCQCMVINSIGAARGDAGDA